MTQNGDNCLEIAAGVKSRLRFRRVVLTLPDCPSATAPASRVRRPASRPSLTLLQIAQRRTGGFPAGVATHHAAALLPAALALDLVGGGAILGHAPGHALPAAVTTEELPIGQSGGTSYGLHTPGDLRFRQPKYFLINVNTRRPDGVQGPPWQRG